MTREEKRQMRVERYKELAKNAEKQSDQALSQSYKMGEVIPFGQPILVGNHSERSDRAYRAKIGAKMDQAVLLSRKADYYADKAKAAERNNSIYLEDSDSVEKLQEKIDRLTKIQEFKELISTSNWWRGIFKDQRNASVYVQRFKKGTLKESSMQTILKKRGIQKAWVYGKQTPDELTKATLSTYFQCKPEDLFPPKNYEDGNKNF